MYPDSFGWPEPSCTFPAWATKMTWRDLSGHHIYQANSQGSTVHYSYRHRLDDVPEVHKAFRYGNTTTTTTTTNNNNNNYNSNNNINSNQNNNNNNSNNTNNNNNNNNNDDDDIQNNNIIINNNNNNNLFMSLFYAFCVLLAGVFTYWKGTPPRIHLWL